MTKNQEEKVRGFNCYSACHELKKTAAAAAIAVRGSVFGWRDSSWYAAKIRLGSRQKREERRAIIGPAT